MILLQLPSEAVINGIAPQRLIPCLGYVGVEEPDAFNSMPFGLVTSPDGNFLTFFHVGENAAAIRARFEGNIDRWHKVVYLDEDRLSDIDVLELEEGIYRIRCWLSRNTSLPLLRLSCC